MVEQGKKKMINLYSDVTIIGAGPAGLAAAVSAKKNGAKKVIVLDRNNWLGGILYQCIHDGFGVEELGKSLTGPEYADIYITEARKNKIEFLTETMVLNLNKKLEITAINKKGLLKIRSKSIILAMGCREKTRWNIMIPGDRPSGIYTAGVAQGFTNLYNIKIGKKVLILGSGDVGLIMARRLMFEGLDVLGVVEILPYGSGLPRNIVQCLDDYQIPLYLTHTVTEILGRERLESVKIAQVDENMKVISHTEREILCDTLLLSVGLTPENELSKDIGVKIDEKTGGPIVNQNFETSLPGVFACGNCLQVYDTVDSLSKDAKIAGKFASIKNKKKISKEIIIKPGKNISYIVPQKIDKSCKVHFSLRVKKPIKKPILIVKSKENQIFKKKLRFAIPANMLEFEHDINVDKMSKTLEVLISE